MPATGFLHRLAAAWGLGQWAASCWLIPEHSSAISIEYLMVKSAQPSAMVKMMFATL